MSYVKKTITKNSTKLEFIKTFIKELTAADSRIVCESDEAAIASLPIYININNSCKIKISVNHPDFYNFDIITNTRTILSEQQMYFTDNNTYDVEWWTRTYNFSVISFRNTAMTLALSLT